TRLENSHFKSNLPVQDLDNVYEEPNKSNRVESEESRKRAFERNSNDFNKFSPTKSLTTKISKILPFEESTKSASVHFESIQDVGNTFVKDEEGVSLKRISSKKSDQGDIDEDEIVEGSSSAISGKLNHLGFGTSESNRNKSTVTVPAANLNDDEVKKDAKKKWDWNIFSKSDK
ncbi:hypothetical protein CANMA_000695, partial [Candida margitis]|uniref:uncharacterized protein n=1 Tax=Candida margitis TaxID=1775924 RepID=UPI00222679C7